MSGTPWLFVISLVAALVELALLLWIMTNRPEDGPS